jgi:hypothetical protein
MSVGARTASSTNGKKHMSAIRIAVIVSLIIPAFTGTVAAQNVGQSDLCDLEARSISAVTSANAQVRSEGNPLRRNELGQAANKIASDAYRARLDFFGAKYGVLNSGEIHNQEGSRPFTGFTGKVVRFEGDPSTSFTLSIALDCPQPKPRPLILGTRILSLTGSTPVWMTSITAPREALLQTAVGSAVEFSGTIFVLVSPRSPMIDTDETVYAMKVIALRNRLSGAIDRNAPGTATRPQQHQLESPQRPSGITCSVPCSYCDTSTGQCIIPVN